jgi:hypothetical protein
MSTSSIVLPELTYQTDKTLDSYCCIVQTDEVEAFFDTLLQGLKDQTPWPAGLSRKTAKTGIRRIKTVNYSSMTWRPTAEHFSAILDMDVSTPEGRAFWTFVVNNSKAFGINWMTRYVYVALITAFAQDPKAYARYYAETLGAADYKLNPHYVSHALMNVLEGPITEQFTAPTPEELSTIFQAYAGQITLSGEDTEAPKGDLEHYQFDGFVVEALDHQGYLTRLGTEYGPLLGLPTEPNTRDMPDEKYPYYYELREKTDDPKVTRPVALFQLSFFYRRSGTIRFRGQAQDKAWKKLMSRIDRRRNMGKNLEILADTA